MKNATLCAFLATVSVWAAPAEARTQSLPFVVVDPASRWKSVSIQKTMAPDVTVEQVIVRAGKTDRFVVLSSPKNSAALDSLSTFSDLLKEAFTTDQNTRVTEQPATLIGYDGRKLEFEMVIGKGTFDCELFVFEDEQTRWGVLYSKTNDSLAIPNSAFSLLQKRIALPSDVVEMTPVRVIENPVSDFDLGFSIHKGTGTDKVWRLVVTEIPEESDDARTPIQVGDELVAIDGRKSQEFTAGADKDSELGRIFLNRNPGDKVTLDFISVTTGQPYTVTLRVPKFDRWTRRWFR